MKPFNYTFSVYHRYLHEYFDIEAPREEVLEYIQTRLSDDEIIKLATDTIPDGAPYTFEEALNDIYYNLDSYEDLYAYVRDCVEERFNDEV